MFTVLSLLVALVGGDPAALQDDQKRPRVEISQSVGPPGGRVALPVRLAGAEAAQLGTVKLTLRFPAASLTFEKAEIGGLGFSVDATATAVSESRGSDVEVTVTLATPKVEGTRESLLDGPVAQLLFTVAKDLEPETVLRLAVEATGTPVGADARVMPLTAKPAEVVVSNPTVIACFFYMH